MYAGLGIVFVAIGVIALVIVHVDAWLGALLIVLGAIAFLAAVVLSASDERRHGEPRG